ncbi:MAG: hypothetical protein ABH851_00490 [Methanobacteriota archaeon]
MTSENLEERASQLEHLHEKMVREAKPVAGIRLDIMAYLIYELNQNENLKKIFGDPVSSKLAIISETDFGIFETDEVPLNDNQKIVFMKELDAIIQKYKDQYGKPGGEVK